MSITQRIVTKFSTENAKEARDAIRLMGDVSQLTGVSLADMASKAADAARAFVQFAKEGEEAAQVGAQFEKLGGGATAMQRLRDATKNLVDDTSLQKIHNLNKTLGLSVENLDKFGTIAVGITRTMGGTVTENMTKLTQEVVKGSVDAVREMGIALRDVTVFEQEFADAHGIAREKMTKADKVLALQQEVLRSSTAQLEAAQGDSNETVQRLTTSYDNFISDLSVAASNIVEEFAPALEGAAEHMRTLGALTMQAVDTFKDLDAITGGGLSESLSQVGNAMGALMIADDLLSPLDNVGVAIRKIGTDATWTTEKLDGLQTALVGVDVAGIFFEQVNSAKNKDAKERALREMDAFFEEARIKTQAYNEFQGQFDFGSHDFTGEQRERDRLGKERAARKARELADAAKGAGGAGGASAEAQQAQIDAELALLQYGADARASIIEFIDGVEQNHADNRYDRAMAYTDLLAETAKIEEERANAMTKGAFAAIQIGGQLAGSFLESESTKAIMAAAMETAKGISNAVTPGMQWAAAGNFASAAAYVYAATQAGKGKGKGVTGGRASRGRGGGGRSQRPEARPQKRAGRTQRTFNSQQIFQFGTGDTGQAIAQAMNETVRKRRGVGLDGRIVRGVGRSGV